MPMRHIVTWPAPLYSLFPHYLINGKILGEKKLLDTKCVFSLQRLSETFLILRRSERDTIKMYIRFHETWPLFLSDFTETRFFLGTFSKNS
jgi:hypothetical protein